MEPEFLLPLNGNMKIIGRGLTIEIVLKEIGGNRHNRKGIIEVIGSPLVDGGSREEVTKQRYVKLASDLEFKVAHRKAPKDYIRFTTQIPDYYKVVCPKE